MKMQNTEMEFVTFDAQDVITTSGGFKWFQISDTLVPDCYGQAFGFNGNYAKWDLDSFDTSKDIKLYLKDAGGTKVKAVDNGYYKIESNATYSASGPFDATGASTLIINGVSSLEGPGAAADALSDIGAILEWLSKMSQ